MSSPTPVVYKAIYSSTEVYECSYNDVPIMRRCKDGWVNATQILKSCNFPKARRTKILEKGVQLGLHEKVQGGFGRFQGTWVPLADAQRLAATYGLQPHHAPVLHLDLSDPNLKFDPRPRPPPKDPTPVKRKYTKKTKSSLETPTKRSRGHSTGPSIDMNDTSNVSYVSMNASFADTSQSPFIPMNNHEILPSSAFPSSNAYPPVAANDGLRSNGYYHVSTKSADMFSPSRGSYQQYQQQQPQQQQHHHHQQQALFPKQPQHYPSHLGSFLRSMPHTGVFQSNHPMQPQFAPNNFVFPNKLGSLSTIESSHDEMSKPHTKESDTSVSSNEDPHSKIPYYAAMPKEVGTKSYAAQLLRFFSDDSQPLPQFLYTMPSDFDIDQPIDDEGHTALHWAASIGNCDIIQLLLSKQANPLNVNNFGLNPLSKLILFNNCYEMRNFDRVLNLLEMCLIHTDINGRTPLHYLMEFAKSSSKRESLGFYLEHIFCKLHAMSEANASNKVDLVRNVIDHRDVNGDTCLHLAIKSGCAEFCKLLLLHGARDDLVNSNKETARYLLSQLNFQEPLGQNITLHLHQQQPLAHNTQQQQQQQQQMHPQQPIYVAERPAPPVFVTEPQQNHSFIMETPVPMAVETPETNGSTIARADSEDDAEQLSASVSHRQLESLRNMHDMERPTPVVDKENKENVFYGSTTPTKTILGASAARRASYNPANSGMSSLPAISETTAESTPIKDEKRPVFEHLSRVTHLPRPPALDADGKAVPQTTEPIPPARAGLSDVSSMVLSMVNSLGDNFEKEIRDLDQEIHRLTKETATRKVQCDATLVDMRHKMLNAGLASPVSFTAADEAVASASSQCAEELQRLDTQLQQLLQRLYAAKVAEVVAEKSELDGTESPSDLAALASKLTQLQLAQESLVQQYAHGLKSYGADDKMYKFRKLIGLSCGVRVDEVDHLIDRILDHLVESGSQ